MFEKDSKSKITVRNLDEAVMGALSALADSHDRSVEAEARYAIRNWVQPQLDQGKRFSRLDIISQKLNYLVAEINSMPSGTTASASRFAEALNWAHACEIEAWFAGEEEPSFSELKQIAGLLGCSENWLVHNEGSPFACRTGRVSEDPFLGADDMLTPDSTGQRPKLHLVRCQSEQGQFAFVQQYSKWKSQTFFTPYHISDETGNGGAHSLAWLSLVFEELYWRYTHPSEYGDVIVLGYLIDEKSFSALLEGKRHPMNVLKEASRSTWWEDFWDETQFSKREYWPGWGSVTSHIFELVNNNRAMSRKRQLLREGRGQKA